jgi:hypothetical protein
MRVYPQDFRDPVIAVYKSGKWGVSSGCASSECGGCASRGVVARDASGRKGSAARARDG